MGLNQGRGWNRGLSKKNGDVLNYGKPRSLETKHLISQRLKEVLIKQGEIRVCQICGKEIYVHQSNIKRGNGKFCSKRCSAIAKNAIQKDYDTDIELILEDWLKENNIQFEKQKIIAGISVVDFFIKPNICLYADGDYWHSFSKVKNRDCWINMNLEDAGYRVIRLLGSEIKKGVRPSGDTLR